MKKLLNIFSSAGVVIIPLLLMYSITLAQPGKGWEEKKEQIETMKIAFITQKLDLTKEEAQKFWPVYNEYRDALDALRKERREKSRSFNGNFDELSEKELTEMADNQIVYRQRELDLMKKYHAEFKGVLPIKKVAMLYRAEEEFRAQMIREMKQRKNYH